MTGTFSKIENSSYYLTPVIAILNMQAYLAQLVERKTFNLVVVGSSPTVGILVSWCNRLALRTLNPPIRVQFPAKPLSSIAQLAERSAVNR